MAGFRNGSGIDVTSTARAPQLARPAEEGAGVRGAVRRIPGGSRVLLVVDDAVASATAVSGAVTDLRRSGTDVDVARTTRPPTTDDVRHLSDRIAGAPGTWVIGIGGGSAMDSAALAALWASDALAATWCARSQRSGLVLLPGTVDRAHPLMLVPTTIGTGAESSRSACFVHAEGRRLVVHPSFRSDTAVYDDDLLATTPAALVSEGKLEILYRLSVALIGAAGQRSRDDSDIVAAVRELVTLAQAPETAATRRALAEASARSHHGALMTDVDPFAGKLWYVATETSDVRECRKVAAIAGLLPSMFTLIGSGRTGWGAPDRLTRLWETVRSASVMPLPEAPDRGVQELILQWGVQPVRPRLDDVETIVHRAVRRWGGGLPMLRGVRSEDVRELVAGAAERGSRDHRGPPGGDRALGSGHPDGSAMQQITTYEGRRRRNGKTYA